MDFDDFGTHSLKGISDERQIVIVTQLILGSGCLVAFVELECDLKKILNRWSYLLFCQYKCWN